MAECAQDASLANSCWQGRHAASTQTSFTLSPTALYASSVGEGCCREVRRQTCDLVTLMDVAQPLSHYFMFMEDDFRYACVRPASPHGGCHHSDLMAWRRPARCLSQSVSELSSMSTRPCLCCWLMKGRPSQKLCSLHDCRSSTDAVPCSGAGGDIYICTCIPHAHASRLSGMGTLIDHHCSVCCASGLAFEHSIHSCR